MLKSRYDKNVDLSLTPLSRSYYILIFLISFLLFAPKCRTQSQLFQPADTLNKKRFWSAIGVSTATYSAFTIGLNALWYADYERSSFHLFNDWNEWQNMDKYGHAYNGYFQSQLVYSGARWTGLDKSSSLWVGMGSAMLFQSTIEVLDGFSKEWGFSVPDMAFNIAGSALFGLQQHFWDEQKILIKFSAFPVDHPNLSILSNEGHLTTLQQRAQHLFGTGLPSRILKDYNAQTLWLSVNPKSFLYESHLPSWLNIAFGLGSQNMYGGFNNTWTNEDGTFQWSQNRYQQYYLSLDVDLTKIQTNSPFLKSLLRILNIVKIPFPAIEYNSKQGFVGHWIHF